MTRSVFLPAYSVRSLLLASFALSSFAFLLIANSSAYASRIASARTTLGLRRVHEFEVTFLRCAVRIDEAEILENAD